MRKGAARKKQRMLIVFSGLAMLGVAVSLVLVAFEDNVTFFYGPTEVRDQAVGEGTKFRLGGLVEEGSVNQNGATTEFTITDLNATVRVAYTGILPDLFREGQGIVAQGAIDSNGVFKADEVLAKHDENYMPAEAVEAMKRAGTWQHATSSAQ
ncbi:MAG: cytochrome c maturation protein CcmE [Alphaproteobacteria bacterium]|nr:cytochrome c maturation protein CcmE [Alphaproteobacteria bacterium]